MSAKWLSVSVGKSLVIFQQSISHLGHFARQVKRTDKSSTYDMPAQCRGIYLPSKDKLSITGKAGEAWQHYKAVLELLEVAQFIHQTSCLTALGWRRDTASCWTQQLSQEMASWYSRATGLCPQSCAGMTPAVFLLDGSLSSECVSRERVTALHGCINIRSLRKMNMLTFEGQTCFSTSSPLSTSTGIFIMKAEIPLGLYSPSHETLYLWSVLKTIV